MNKNGTVLYHGPSALNPEHDVVVIAVGIRAASTNRKTGNMIQIYILHADQSPVDAVRSGADSVVCGDCKHRGIEGFTGRTCYVNVGQGATSVWRCWKRDRYPTAANIGRRFRRHEWARGRLIRFGTYGDPAAVPFELWQGIAEVATGWTGYTHQWRTCDSRFSRLMMASCETEEEARLARLKGYRVFRTKLPGEPDQMRGEAVCPAAKESKAALQCHQCLACCGTDSGRRGHIGIRAHGSSATMANVQRRYAGGSDVASFA